MTEELLAGAVSYAHLAGVASMAKKANDETKEYDDEEKDDGEGKPKSRKAKRAEDDDEEMEDKEDCPKSTRKAKRASDGDDEGEDEKDEEDERKKEDDDEDEDGDRAKSRKAKKASEDEEKDDDDKERAAEKRGRRAERARMAKVMGSKAVVRNLPLAVRLLTTTSMASADIIAAVREMPAAAGVPVRRNPDLGPNGGPGPGAMSSIQKGWERAFAKAGARTVS